MSFIYMYNFIKITQLDHLTHFFILLIEILYKQSSQHGVTGIPLCNPIMENGQLARVNVNLFNQVDRS